MLNDLAVLYRYQGRFVEAGQLYLRVLAISEKTLGSVHPYVVTALINCAQLLRGMKRTAEARTLEARGRRLDAGLETMSADGAIATGVINADFACFRLSVHPSKIHRRGVFAEEHIPAGRKVIEYTGERVSRREAKRRMTAHPLTYLFELDDY